MKIDKFYKKEFGTITSITSHKTGVVMFLAADVAKMWGHTNITQVIKRILNSDEHLKVKKSDHQEFFNDLVTNKVLSAKTQHVQLLTESGLYKLALASNLEKAKPFRDWVASDVLPSIRKNGYYSIADQSGAILIHTNVSIQKFNSKEINKKNYANGKDSVIDYNKTSCILHTGKTTTEIKEIGKKAGLKSVERSSAKEVLRHIKPELACAMSFTDSLVKKGFDLKTVSELSLKSAVPLFQGMIELGIKPQELK